MPDIEMLPRWWRYAIEAAGVARREIRQMHPDEREVHDTTPDECTETIRRIRLSGAVDAPSWTTVELTDADVRVIREGLVDILFIQRDKTPERWKPATRWSGARDNIPVEHERVLRSLP